MVQPKIKWRNDSNKLQKVIQEVSNTSNTYPIFLGDELVFSLNLQEIFCNIWLWYFRMIESKYRDGDDLNCLLLLRELRSNDLVI